jgi:hypothetical protein
VRPPQTGDFGRSQPGRCTPPGHDGRLYPT